MKKDGISCDFAQYIQISDLLELDDYYKTDTHWRQEKITDAAVRLAQAMGTQPAADFSAHLLEQDFYGVYYGQAALPFAPDALYYLSNQAIERCVAYDWQNQREIPVYQVEKAAGRDAYEMFLSGVAVSCYNRRQGCTDWAQARIVSGFLWFKHRSAAAWRV